MKTDIELCKKYSRQLDNGFFTVDLDGFAEACFNQNSEDELRDSLNLGSADKTDCGSWNITPTEWRESIERALAAKIISRNADMIPS